MVTAEASTIPFGSNHNSPAHLSRGQFYFKFDRILAVIGRFFSAEPVSCQEGSHASGEDGQDVAKAAQIQTRPDSDIVGNNFASVGIEEDSKKAYGDLVRTLFQQAVAVAQDGLHTAEYEGLQMLEEQEQRAGPTVSTPYNPRISSTLAALDYHRQMMDGTPRGRKLQENWKRQIILETRAVDAAVARYRRDFAAAINRGAGATMPAARRLLTGWFNPLKESIKEEQEKIVVGEPGMDRFVYGPYLLRLDPEKLAVITMHATMNAFMSPEEDAEAMGSSPGTARMTRLAINIGRAVESQYHVNRLEKEVNQRNKEIKEVRVLHAEGTALREKFEQNGWPDIDDPAWQRWMQIGKELQDLGEMMPTDHCDWFANTPDLQSRIMAQLEKLPKNAPSWKEVRRMVSRAKRLLSDELEVEWRSDIHAKIGVILIKLMMEVCKIDVERDGQLQTIPAFWHGLETGIDTKSRGLWKKYGLLFADEEVMRRIAMHHMTEAFVPQFLPMVIPPVPWQRQNLGGHLTLRGSVMRIRGSHLQRSLLENADIEMIEGKSKGLSQIYEALNALGSTAWSINQDVYRIIEAIWAWGGGVCDIPPRLNFQVPEPLRPGFVLYSPSPGRLLLGTRPKSDIRKRLNEIQIAKKRNNELHSLRCDMEYKLVIAREFSREERFYYPHNVDFRGRAYPMHPHLTHLGSDISRGLLQFADAKPLGPNGLRWLYIQAANLWGQGVDKLPLEGRIKWVQDHLGAILDNAVDPFRKPSSKVDGAKDEGLENHLSIEPTDGPSVLRSLMIEENIDVMTPYWWRADSPFQFLATCFDLHGALSSGDPSSYRSCLPVHQDGSCNGLQHYAALGRDETGGWTVNLCPVERPQDVYTEIARLVNQKVEADAAAEKWEAQTLLASTSIDRKLVKQTVMTSVYGVTYVGARTQISNRLRERGFEDNREMYLVSCYSARVTLDCLHKMFQSAKFIMQWLNECARLVAQKDHAVRWTTPLGLPVVQPYRRKTQHHVRTVLQRLIVAMDNDEKPVMKARQRSAFPPNFIHSIDSSHMMLTAIACREAGLDFAGVHDSFWTHAGTVDTMNTILREKFIEMHSQPLLENLLEELQTEHPDLTFPPLPIRGNLDLGAIRKATYFFS